MIYRSKSNFLVQQNQRDAADLLNAFSSFLTGKGEDVNKAAEEFLDIVLSSVNNNDRYKLQLCRRKFDNQNEDGGSKDYIWETAKSDPIFQFLAKRGTLHRCGVFAISTAI